MSANGAKKEKTMINIKDYVSVQSDEVFSLRDLPWADCKPPTVNGVKIIAQAGRDLCGEIVTLMVLNYPILNCVAYRKSTETAWTIATRWLGCESNYDLNVDEACRYVDRWIESKVSRNKLENKEPESVKRPDPPKGYRMCSREEASEIFDTKNATITYAKITNDDHGCLIIWLGLDYGGSGQAFGGHVLYLPTTSKNHEIKSVAGHYIWRIMEIAGVTEWSELKGKNIRVIANHCGVEKIGHILKDDWFCPRNDFANL